MIICYQKMLNKFPSDTTYCLYITNAFNMSDMYLHLDDSERTVIILPFKLVTQEDRFHGGRK